jgi:apolipoprotein N-acyltransferase
LEQETLFYHKNHLVPFGEYIPFKNWLGNIMRWLDVPMSDFSAGDEYQKNLQAVGQSVGVSICYEDAYGERIRSTLPEATLLVNVSNDAWFGESAAPFQHLEIARMRAVETGRYLLRATNTGISAIINAKGKIMMKSPQFEIYSLYGNARAFTGATFFIQWGNLLMILLSMGGILWGLHVKRTASQMEYHTLNNS